MGFQEGHQVCGYLRYLLHPVAHLQPAVSVAAVPSFKMAEMHFVFEDWHGSQLLLVLVKSPKGLGFYLLPT